MRRKIRLTNKHNEYRDLVKKESNVRRDRGHTEGGKEKRGWP